ncbi:MAG: hypothetical protein AAGM29_05390 [Cyanobacteria bacterium J06588_4]
MEQPTADLAIALRSEVLGEAFFRSAYYAALFSSSKNTAKILWQLETQTKNRIIAYFAVNNLEVPKLRWTAAKGSILGVFSVFFPRHVVLREILKETEYYLAVFLRLEEQAPAKDKELFKYIVAHEVAIAEFAKIELTNSVKNSLEPIAALINR